ncbi:hypothetical protein AAF712_006041 [Marasmius tenuissimus]|uniref:Uncharacterized protein n=1 Tax=Marasmius tenuissimus TaxID=585030 RepID=A0ABR2ZYM4_9AGAR
MSRFPAPSGIKGFLPSYKEQVMKQRDAITMVRALVRDALNRLHSDYPSTAIIERPTENGGDLLTDTLISLYQTFDASPNASPSSS